MDSKKTLILGVVLLVVGVIACLALKLYVIQLIGGLFALACLLAGLLFLGMGYLEAKEDSATRAKDAAEAAKAEEMAAKE